MPHGLACCETAMARQSSCKMPHPFLLLLGVAVLTLACSPTPDADRQVRTITGPTMGTSYAVKVVDIEPAKLKRLQLDIERELVRLNLIFSTYVDDSEISRLNQQRQVGEYEISLELWRVLRRAKALSVITDGAFDITVSPLIELWGFGQQSRPEFSVIESKLPALMARTGHQLYSLPEEGVIVKHHAEVNLDVSAIAKGYAVDALADLLRRHDINDFLIEIGGETRAGGKKGMHDPWAVGLEAPLAGKREIRWTLNLHNQALASSGDYRNYFEHDGQRYSHLLDPRTGYPLRARNIAINVLAADCMEADAWATALAILGREAGLALAETRGVAVQFVEGDAYYRSEEFEKLVTKRIYP